jgi:diguanylate cyclase (GGDEF)-like protein
MVALMLLDPSIPGSARSVPRSQPAASGAKLGNGISREVAFAGQRVRRKMLIALALCSGMPFLLFTYSLFAYTMPLLDPVRHARDFVALPALLLFTGLLTAAGAFVAWDVATAVSRAASLVADPKTAEPVTPARADEIGTLVTSFSRMVETIEQQAQEINQFPRRMDELARQAFHDPLTTLPNRALFIDRLAHALARTEGRSEQVAVLLLDLDRFKVINDSLRRGVGDRLLVEVSRRLQACLRPEHTLARLGGDEFGILLEDVHDVSAATSMAEWIATQLQTPFSFDGREVFITASVGIELSRSGQAGPEDILRDADLALDQAKTRGKARYEVFDQNMNAPALERLDLEIDLRSAVTRQELRVHYQPVVILETGRIAEVEALVRWEHRQRGLLPPEDFIGLAEETGLIVPIGQWVLAEACRRARAWQREHPSEPPLIISVNLSARQLQQPDLVHEIAEALRESGLDPASLKLEITESVVMQDAPSTLAKLHALRELGIQLAMDDFGTGYSSLGYLKRFPVDTLKIDRSFVKGIGHNPEDRAIVRAVVEVARSLHLSVTAEGIETAEQVAQLRTLGCERGQGYYFARPLAPGSMEALFAVAHRERRYAGGAEGLLIVPAASRALVPLSRDEVLVGSGAAAAGRSLLPALFSSNGSRVKVRPAA